ncbi:XVIPCD domain-containing protein [Stenotrophomonas sp.]|uniref:XVIPCD domain-containing protein n=1 Tax=Stenotrophomonas sp. TaxID=69392 RepID=UPI0028AD26FD|nr:XVIPCD domain-containing protein [Stenotrophomonas sp.]
MCVVQGEPSDPAHVRASMTVEEAARRPVERHLPRSRSFRRPSRSASRRFSRRSQHSSKRGRLCRWVDADGADWACRLCKLQSDTYD